MYSAEKIHLIIASSQLKLGAQFTVPAFFQLAFNCRHFCRADHRDGCLPVVSKVTVSTELAIVRVASRVTILTELAIIRQLKPWAASLALLYQLLRRKLICGPVPSSGAKAWCPRQRLADYCLQLKSSKKYEK